ncbi:MAG TPA: AraC family transcriptional regulator [Edaphobacter sp.]|nr:AraC family transcriptional regulator [Edaphobacter sp.]
MRRPPPVCLLDALSSEVDAMLYLERRPHPALAPYIKLLWYCRYPDAPHQRQIILPTGHLQVVISLTENQLTDCTREPGTSSQSQPFSVLVGIHSHYQVIDSADLAHLIGILFHPGGTIPFFSPFTHLFTNLEASLEDIWGSSANALRDRLREASTPDTKFDALEAALLGRLARAHTPARNPLIDFSLNLLHASPGTATIAALARTTGLSPRRLSQLFREQVGVSPKLYCRIQRFQQAVQQLHRGVDLPWSELALSCGYYDQSHFANDFRAFSGISPTTYSTASRPWSNHIALD